MIFQTKDHPRHRYLHRGLSLTATIGLLENLRSECNSDTIEVSQILCITIISKILTFSVFDPYFMKKKLIFLVLCVSTHKSSYHTILKIT